MAKDETFDITTGVDLQEVDNALNQARKEIENRFDFKNVLVEIWQVDGNGVYLHTGDRFGQREGNRDANFQGFGRFLTGSSGEYYFRTVKPVPYPGRTPHIHFKLKQSGERDFTTQCYVKGHPQNERDGVYRGIRDAKARDSVTVDFAPIPESKLGELAANFDIVLGMPPGDG